MKKNHIVFKIFEIIFLIQCQFVNDYNIFVLFIALLPW